MRSRRDADSVLIVMTDGRARRAAGLDGDDGSGNEENQDGFHGALCIVRMILVACIKMLIANIHANTARSLRTLFRRFRFALLTPATSPHYECSSAIPPARRTIGAG